MLVYITQKEYNLDRKQVGYIYANWTAKRNGWLTLILDEKKRSITTKFIKEKQDGKMDKFERWENIWKQ